MSMNNRMQWKLSFIVLILFFSINTIDAQQQKDQAIVPNAVDVAVSRADEVSGDNTSSTIIDDNDSSNNSALASADESDKHSSPPVGLPIDSQWSILQLSDIDRDIVCNQQVEFCANECGGPEMTSSNFCNQTTMAWNCSCRNKVPDSPPYQWPVTLAECTGREQKCQGRCTDQPTKQLCTEGCTKYFRCNRPGGPQSRLQVIDPDMTPEYNAPTSNATILGCLSDYNNAMPLLSLLVTIIVAIGLYI